MNLSVRLPSKEEQLVIAERIEKQHKIILHVDESINALKDGIVDTSDFDGKWKYRDLQKFVKVLNPAAHQKGRTRPTLWAISLGLKYPILNY